MRTALAHAGLVPRQKAGFKRRFSVSIVELLDRCYEAHGVEPTSRELKVFARANGIPHPRRARGRPWSSYIEEWKEQRQAAGRSVPSEPPPKSQRPNYSANVGAANPGEGRGSKEWQPNELVTWVARYLTELPRGARSSQRGYDQWAAQQPEGAPWSSVHERHGGWNAVRDAARATARQVARGRRRGRST